MVKKVICVRFDEETIDLINEQPGNNFSDKLLKFIHRISLKDLISAEKSRAHRIKSLLKTSKRLEKQLTMATSNIKYILSNPW
jgi:hypothetical protein